MSSEQQEAVVARMRTALDEIDARTHRPGEQPLRQQVADQARQRLDELNASPSRWCERCDSFTDHYASKHLAEDRREAARKAVRRRLRHIVGFDYTPGQALADADDLLSLPEVQASAGRTREES